MDISNLSQWTEITKGIYRYVLAAGACYELIILRHESKQPIEEATATVYITGDWYETVSGKDVFTREVLIAEQSVAVCLAGALQDYLSNVQ